jgi:hypothetical protein
MKPFFAMVLAAFLTLVVSSPAQSKNRPTVDNPNGNDCFADPTTDKNCPSNTDIGAICYCCYDDGCWICGTTPLPGDQCVWDNKYRAELVAPPPDGPMCVNPESGYHLTQEALMNLLEKKKLITRKELAEESMRSRKAHAQGTLEHGRLKESVATQKRINRYFHSVVMPKLKNCWNRIQGNGTIEIKYSYEDKGKEEWAFQTLNVGKSDLPKGQDEVALACMQEAVASTSFPKEKTDRGGASYSINWSWPVPLPPDAAEQAEAMFRSNGGVGGGCDGHGAAASCVTCSGQPVSCTAVCVGGDPPCDIKENPLPGGFSRICTVGSGCASGGAFGVVGGMFIY